ncbi:mucin-associated surface protein (MASP), putative [Trypanosoma cruzi marinkellei]|uniref:Mucin-associated surface protein (MASP), putative n=1 Tax=Trypanosoma cruzi marinkellei TaxID=85056 RepID=K2N565_TRYCR|nr:mucin-associated surface protein (MASP), putative [Trypanosoma cruzi marinkellei]
MTKVCDEEMLVPSYPVSPRPRRQPMASLSTNQRSYSRMSSKGIFGDESPLLLSPLPRYPNRRRSVTFADETEATVREERPYYTACETGNTPGKHPSETPFRRNIIKTTSRTNNATDAAVVVNMNQRNDTTTHAPVAPANSPTIKRGRSSSRQRRAARRHQAELYHGFYDDSFVEDYVLKAKKEIEGEEEEKIVEEKLKQQEKELAEAEMRAAQATVKINALQQAKEYLLATANARCFSPACSSCERRDSGFASSRSCHHSLKKEPSLIQQADGDVEEVGDIEKQRRHPPKKPVKRSMPLVTQMDDMDETGSGKRIRQASSKKGDRSLPIRHDGQNNAEDDDDDDGNEENNMSKRKKAKLERIIARVIEQQAKRRHGNRSVVVIDWDCDGCGELLASDADAEEEETDNDDEEVAMTRVAARSCKEPMSKNPGNAASASAAATSAASTALRQKKQSTARHVSVRAPSRKRGANSASVAPDLGADSLLLEEDQPVLLRRPATRRRAPTRSISYMSPEAEDNYVPDHTADLSRKPPRRTPAPKATGRGRKAPAPATGMAPSPHLFPSSVPPSLAVAHVSQSFKSARHNSHANFDPLEDPPPPPVNSRRRCRTTSAASRPSAPVTSSDDPMAVFFGASFPSPSKFEEMMLAAGGLQETRKVGRGRARQPALLLPDSILRRR